MGSTVHVDDGLIAGEADTMKHVASILKSKYKLELSDVACDVGDVVKFLKSWSQVPGEDLCHFENSTCDQIVLIANGPLRTWPEL